ncbi:MAG: MerR family transcriptional regulator [Christensenellales bacterium]|jgi:DNA-binding transcriptional MerR regulator
MIKYSVSDVARVLGLTPSALHYFERENLISTNKEENGRRYYVIDDVFRLLSYYKYRSMGFRFKTVVNQFGGSENDRKLIEERVRRQKEEALSKEAYYHNLAKFIDEHLEGITQIDRLLDNYEFVRSPEVLLLHDQECGWISKDRNAQDVAEKWVSAMPATRLSLMLNDGSPMFCYSVSPQNAELLHLPLALQVCHLEATSCLHTIVAAGSDFPENPAQVFEAPLEYARSRGFEVSGTPWGTVLLVEVASMTDIKPYVEVWIPIK